MKLQPTKMSLFSSVTGFFKPQKPQKPGMLHNLFTTQPGGVENLLLPPVGIYNNGCTTTILIESEVPNADYTKTAKVVGGGLAAVGIAYYAPACLGYGVYGVVKKSLASYIQRKLDPSGWGMEVFGVLQSVGDAGLSWPSTICVFIGGSGITYCLLGEEEENNERQRISGF